MTTMRARVSIVPDTVLLVAACALACGGLLIARALAMEEARRAFSSEMIRQSVYIGVGLIAMAVASRTDYRLLRTLAPQLYVAGAIGLVLVLVLGSHEYGARRWIGIGGGITVQPSEFAKIAVAVGAAAFAADRRATGRAATVLLGLVGFMAALIIVEPDLGTAIVLGLTWFAIAMAWGVSWRYLGGLALVVRDRHGERQREHRQAEQREAAEVAP